MQYRTVAVHYFLLIMEEFSDAILPQTICHQKKCVVKVIIRTVLVNSAM
jgi:hypothetical protein